MRDHGFYNMCSPFLIVNLPLPSDITSASTKAISFILKSDLAKCLNQGNEFHIEIPNHAAILILHNYFCSVCEEPPPLILFDDLGAPLSRWNRSACLDFNFQCQDAFFFQAP